MANSAQQCRRLHLSRRLPCQRLGLPGFVALVTTATLNGCGLFRIVAFNKNPQRFGGFEERNFLAYSSPTELTRSNEPDFGNDVSKMASCFGKHERLKNHLNEFATLNTRFEALLRENTLLPANVGPFPSSELIGNARRLAAVPANAQNAKYKSIPLPEALTAPLPEQNDVLFSRIKGPLHRSVGLFGFEVVQNKNAGSVYATATPDVSPTAARTAAEYLSQTNTVPVQETVPYQSAEFLTRSFYVRSLQAGNTFQIQLQCAQVSLQFGANSAAQKFVWPRTFIVETGNIIAESGNNDPVSTRVFFARPSVVAETTAAGPQLQQGPLALFQTTIREQHLGASNASVNLLRVAEGSFANDGAGTGAFFTYQREAGSAFFSRFAGSTKTPTQAFHSFASYQPGINKVSFSSQSNRNEQGGEFGFSPEQNQWFVAHPLGIVAASADLRPPDSPWTSASGFQPLQRTCEPTSGVDGPDFLAGGLHSVDSSQISKYITDVSTSNLPPLPIAEDQLMAVCKAAFSESPSELHEESPTAP